MERQKLCESLDKIVLTCADSTREEVAPLQPPEPYLELDDGSYSCNFCGKKYKMLGSLNTHLSKNHAVANAVSFECRNCKKKCETQFKLTRHLKTCKYVNYMTLRYEIYDTLTTVLSKYGKRLELFVNKFYQ